MKALAPAAHLSSTFGQIINDSFILEGLEKRLGFETPTPIQVAVTPHVLQGRNIFAGAKTGSGKTIAFIAPIAERLFKNEIKKAIVLAPTRELVLQIDEETAKLLDGQGDVVSVPLYGGVPIDGQILAIKHHKPRLYIATPGRTLDLFQEGIISPNEIELCVLDEADRMCDMGFAPQVTEILEHLVNSKQTLLFSATLPAELSTMMNRFCPDPVRIQVDAADRSSETIQHQAIFCMRKEKIHRLLSVLKNPDLHAIVFARTRHGASALHRSLERKVERIGILHAGYSMGDRERTIRAFREGELRILIATDVVARGIDVDKITHVIHFDLPDSLEDYIHRSGRSGRAGRSGQTIAFFEKDSRDSQEKLHELKKKVKFENLEVPEGRSDTAQTKHGNKPALHRESTDRRSPRAHERHQHHPHKAIKNQQNEQTPKGRSTSLLFRAKRFIKSLFVE